MSFENLGLVPTLLSAVSKAGFSTPTAVQASAIPQALAGHDLMVSAQTGSGKTAAFMLPALNRIAQMPANKGSGVQVLVLTPTRELAMQVADATKLYGAHIKDLRTAVVVGGMPYGAQLKALSRRVDVLVATPGRLIDHLQARRVDLSTVHTLVLDEADRMLDMGFIEDIETIVASTPAARQTLLFSATLDGSIARLAGQMMRDPQRIDVSGHKEKHSNITQSLLYADDHNHKMRLLDHLLRDASLDQAIVFTSTKRGADDLADRLSEQGFTAAALHGDMNQRQRTRTLGMLQNRKLRILVATDVAARGIDVQGISHAINYDLPMQPEDYTHRIGRTGRAGNNGLAFTLATHSERHKIRRIEHFIGQPIPSEVIEGLEPKKTVRPTYTDRKPGGKKPYGARGGFSGGGKPAYAGKSDDRSGDRPSYGKPEGRFGDKPSFGKPEGRFGDKPSFSKGDDRFGDRPSYGKPEGRFGDKPSFSKGEGRFGDKPSFSKGEGRFGDKPSFGKPEGRFGDKPSFGKPEGRFGDKPAYEGRKEGYKGREQRAGSFSKPAAAVDGSSARPARARPAFSGSKPAGGAAKRPTTGRQAFYS